MLQKATSARTEGECTAEKVRNLKEVPQGWNLALWREDAAASGTCRPLPGVILLVTFRSCPVVVNNPSQSKPCHGTQGLCGQGEQCRGAPQMPNCSSLWGRPDAVKRKKSSFFLLQPRCLPPVPSLLANLTASQLTEEKWRLLHGPAHVSYSRQRKVS